MFLGGILKSATALLLAGQVVAWDHEEYLHSPTPEDIPSRE